MRDTSTSNKFYCCQAANTPKVQSYKPNGHSALIVIAIAISNFDIVLETVMLTLNSSADGGADYLGDVEGANANNMTDLCPDSGTSV